MESPSAVCPELACRRADLLHLMSCDLPLVVAIQLNKLYVPPTMECASAVWHGSLREEDAEALERVQAAVARRLLRADWQTPKSSLFERLDWPALHWRREIASLTLFHQFLQRRPQPLAACLFSFAGSSSNRSRRKPLQLLLPHARSTRLTKSFFYRSALLWNSLPSHIQALKTSNTFREAIEIHWHDYKYTTDKNIPIPLSTAF